MLELVCVKEIFFSFNHRQNQGKLFFYYITTGYKFCLALILPGFIFLLFSFIATVSIFSERTSYPYVRFYDDISFCSGSRLGPLLPGQFLDLTLWRSGSPWIRRRPHGVLSWFLKYLESCFLIDLVLEDFFLNCFLLIYTSKDFKALHPRFCFCY